MDAFDSRSFSIAQKAAQEASAAAEAQLMAGQRASQQVREQLAEKAREAAQAAEAAVAGKESVVEQLEEEVREAQDVSRKQTSSLLQGQTLFNAVMHTAKQSQAELKILTNALQVAQVNAANAEQASIGAQEELCEKGKIIEHVRGHKDFLMQRLEAAKLDLKNTKKIVLKVCMAAQEAQANVLKHRRKTLRQIRSLNFRN